jgi:hypothetical protein
VAEPYRQPAQLFLGSGSARFSEVRGTDAGSYWHEAHVGRAAAFADYDNDGRIDIAVNHNGERPALLHNETEPAGHSIRLALTGTTSNRSAFGTRVIATEGNRRYLREVVPGRSYLSAHDRRIFFGLGEAKSKVRLEIRWPTRNIYTIADVLADEPIALRERPNVPDGR